MKTLDTPCDENANAPTAADATPAAADVQAAPVASPESPALTVEELRAALDAANALLVSRDSQIAELTAEIEKLKKAAIVPEDPDEPMIQQKVRIGLTRSQARKSSTATGNFTAAIQGASPLPRF